MNNPSTSPTTSRSGLNSNVSAADHDRWVEGWSQFMVKMWRERMMQFAPPVYDTGALSRSVQGIVHPGPVTTIEHRFLEYGIYVCRGVGNGYRRGNPGDLPFLKDWKTNPHHRQKRDWFACKYMYSIHRLNDFEAAFYGTTYQGMVSSFLYQLFAEIRCSIGVVHSKQAAHALYAAPAARHRRS